MTRVVLAKKAVDDFLTILADLMSSAGPLTASSYDAKLKRLIARLASRPESGCRPKLGRGIRLVLMLPYVVFYTYHPQSDVVSIVRVRHQRRRMGSARTYPPLRSPLPFAASPPPHAPATSRP